MNPHLNLGTASTGSYVQHVPVRLTIEDCRQHILLAGRSGVGKSTLLLNIFAQKANCGHGAILIDPHGELAEQALDCIPPRRIRKTIYLNPSDLDWPVGFNILDGVAPDDRAPRAAAIVAAFKSVWRDSWGPRLEQILYCAIAALLEMEGATLLCVPRLLLDRSYRDGIVKRLKDPVIADFWRVQFPLYEKKFGMEAFAPALNKIGQVLVSPTVRNIVGQPKSAFHPRHLMDNNWLVICNFSKGRLGEQHANLLGALLIALFGSAALSRSDTPPEARKDFAMIVDEFHNYTTDSFANLLAEVRKYRLSLVLAHQYLDQITPTVRSAVLGTVGSLIAFRGGTQDANTFADELSPLTPAQLMDIPNFTAWSRITIGGSPCGPLLLQTPPPPASHGNAHKVIANSRIHFATARASIEARILRFFSSKLHRSPPHW